MAEVVIDRVTLWRCQVEHEVITRVDAEADG